MDRETKIANAKRLIARHQRSFDLLADAEAEEKSIWMDYGPFRPDIMVYVLIDMEDE